MPDATSFTIRPRRTADTEKLGKAHAQIWHEAYEGSLPEELLLDRGPAIARAMNAEMPQGEKTGHFVVENAEGRIVGFGDCGPAQKTSQLAPAEIYNIYLLQEAQRSGLGRKLLFTLLGFLAREGFKSAALRIHADQSAARKFYESCGGIPAGDRDAMVDGRVFREALYMWKDIQSLLKDSAA